MTCFAFRWLVVLLAIALGLADFAGAQARRTVVEIEVRQFGVNSHFRPGDITAVQFAVRIDPASDLPEAVPVLVQWEVPNADGDIVEYQRPTTLTRGRDTHVWIYAPLMPSVDRDTIWVARVFDMSDGRRGAELGGRRIRPSDVGAQRLEITDGMIGVIGQRHMRLTDYSQTFDALPRLPSAHEFTRVVVNIQPERVPDRWRGLKGFEAIAWSDATPQMLGSDAAASIREYIRRGGHLIISIPEDTNPWQFGVEGQTPLDDLLPTREPRKDETVHIRELVPMLSKAETTEADFTYGVRVFRDLKGDFNAIDPPYQPLIAMPDGRVVVIQRTFGHGHITIVGVDLAQQRLYAVPLSNGARGLPQADAFWNRILGRRIDTPTATELEAMRREEMLATPRSLERNLGRGALFSQQIAMSTQAGVGLLLALILFAAYWVLAGPGGFGLLKLYKQSKHAWVAFAAAAVIFTGLAWGAVSMIRISEPQVQHVTILDHIVRPDGDVHDNDPQYQRAVSWLSLYSPGYGRVPIEIPSERGQRNILSSWYPPGDDLHAFPNVDRYSIDVGRSPASYAIPSRSTSTHMYANWMGGLDPAWGGMIRPHPNDPVRVQYSADGREVGLRGTLYHDLPGTLRNVSLIWVRNLRYAERRYTRSGEDDSEYPWVPHMMSGQMLNLGFHLSFSEWEPGTALSLDQEFDPMRHLERSIERRYVEDERRDLMRAPGATLRTQDHRRYMEMLSMYHQLTPPTYLAPRAGAAVDENNVIFHRHLAREIDLSSWFNRPCIIIIGFLEDSELPIPLRVGDEETSPNSEGLTMVRWIHPLPLNEDVAFDRLFRDQADEALSYENGLEGESAQQGTQMGR